MTVTKKEIIKIVASLPHITFKDDCGDTLEFFDYELCNVMEVNSDIDMVTLMREISERYVKLGQKQSEVQADV